MDIRRFDRKQDELLMLEGESETIRNSFPDLSIRLTEELRRFYGAIAAGEWEAFTACGPHPIGYIVISTEQFYTIPMGLVLSIYVSPGHRGTGVSHKLLEHAEGHFKSLGVRSMQLEVTVSNHTAVAAYEAFGFKTTRFTMEKPIEP